MVISKKINHRKRKKRENFFGIPFFPLIIFLLLLVILFIIPPIEWQGRNETTPGITGKVVSGLQLTETSYRPKESLEGNLNLNFYFGDLIAWDTNVSFDIVAVKCKNYYICSNGYKVPWEFYNISSGKCENVTLWVYGPWDECGEDKYYEYPGIYGDVDCDEIDGKCCKVNEGVGKFYTNIIDCGSGKECWDDCKTSSKKNLIDSIALSTTPWKGNYTQGTFNNVNGSEPVLPIPVWGFGACPQIAPVPPNVTYPVTYAISGYAMQSQPTYIDLSVLDIYLSDTTPTPTYPVSPTTLAVENPPSVPPSPTKTLYTKITNYGNQLSGPFTLMACWYNYQNPTPTPLAMYTQPVPSNCFKVVRISGMNPGETKVIGLGSWNVEGKSVQVIVDYYNEVYESNEYNNQMIKDFGVVPPKPDFDVLDIYVSGYQVQPLAQQIPVQPTEKLYTQIKNLGGASGSFVVVGCWYEAGTTPTPLMGQVRPIPGNCFFVKTVNSMGAGEIMVLDMGNVDVQGKTVQVIADFYNDIIESNEANNEMIKFFPEVVPLKPDLIVTKIERKSYGTIEGTKITMMNAGTGPVSSVRSFFTKVIYYIGNEKWEQEYQIQVNGSIMPGAKFHFDVMDKDIKGKAIDATAIVDSQDHVDEEDETNNVLSVWLSPYSCEGWNNLYKIALENFGLKAPEYENTYILKTTMVYNTTVLSSDEVYFTVEKEAPTHKACQDNKCVKVSGSGTDQCETNSDCTGAGSCNENWLYGSWSACIGGEMKRECYDANNCSSTYSKPSNCLFYIDGYYQTESCCVSEWQCDEWSVCYEFQGEYVQSMTCRDLNECVPENSSYTQYRDCCIENWDCKWTACINGMQQKICEDINYCGTEFTKPVSETRECERPAGIAWWIWLIIILVLVVVVLAILVGTGRLPLFKKKPKPAEEAKKYPQLQDYIKKAIERGLTKEEIREKLIKSGWPEDIVSKAL